MAQIKATVVNMPHIMHAIVDGMNAAHMAGIVHTDLHPFNIMLNFTRDMHVRVGIIDWGLMLRVGKKRKSLTFVFDAAKNLTLVAERVIWAEREKTRKPWLAPELFDPRSDDAWSKASDVYALGYLLDQLFDFWKVAQKIWMQNSIIVPLDLEIMERISFQVRQNIYILAAEKRKPLPEILKFFRSLKTEPQRAQHPIIELMPAFYAS